MFKTFTNQAIWLGFGWVLKQCNSVRLNLINKWVFGRVSKLCESSELIIECWLIYECSFQTFWSWCEMNSWLSVFGFEADLSLQFCTESSGRCCTGSRSDGWDFPFGDDIDSAEIRSPFRYSWCNIWTLKFSVINGSHVKGKFLIFDLRICIKKVEETTCNQWYWNSQSTTLTLNQKAIFWPHCNLTHFTLKGLNKILSLAWLKLNWRD